MSIRLQSARGWTIASAKRPDFMSLLVAFVVACGCQGCHREGSSVDPPAVPKAASTPSVANLPGKPLFELVDWSDRAGIQFVHTDGSSGRRYIMETVSCGLALFDYDRDGLVDIYFCNGAPLPGSHASEPVPRHALYRNLGNLQFKDVSEAAGVHCTAYGLGIAVADYNNDGWSDIYLSNFGGNVLLCNNGDGTFRDVTSTAGVGRGERVGAGTCFLDVDADGNVDLFAANYVQFSEEMHRAPRRRGRTVYPGPLDYPQESNSLFRNSGDGTWTDASESSGVAATSGTGMGAVCGDFDLDGDTDIYLANDEMSNYLFQNDGQGVFREAAVFSGIAYDGIGLAHGSMGADSADVDNDGLPDLFVTAYQSETATLYRNLGHGQFQDVTALTGAGEGTAANVTWGCGLIDLDNDGDRDLFIASGHLDDREENSVYRAPNLVLMNELIETGQMRFVNVSPRCGDGLRVSESSRGAAMDDLDNDGDLDVVVLNSRRPPTLLKNLLSENGCDHHWLQVRLSGRHSNRDGVGARVRLVAGDLVLVDEVHSGRGYQSHWGTRLHFGLGAHDRVDYLEVQWLGGAIDRLEDVAVDQCLVIRESTIPNEMPNDERPNDEGKLRNQPSRRK